MHYLDDDVYVVDEGSTSGGTYVFGSPVLPGIVKHMDGESGEDSEFEAWVEEMGLNPEICGDMPDLRSEDSEGHPGLEVQAEAENLGPGP